MDRQPPLLELACLHAAGAAHGRLDHLGHHVVFALAAPTADPLRPAADDADAHVFARDPGLPLLADEIRQLHRDVAQFFWAETQNVAGSNSPGVAKAVSGFPIAVRAGTYAGTICSV